MITSNVRLRYGDPDCTNITLPSDGMSRWSTLPRRIARRARFHAEAAFHFYCFRVATAPHKVGAYGSLSCIPDGVPAGVMVLLAAVIILRTTGGAWISRGRNNAVRRDRSARFADFRHRRLTWIGRGSTGTWFPDGRTSGGMGTVSWYNA
jgi:hypothetical protein